MTQESDKRSVSVGERKEPAAGGGRASGRRDPLGEAEQAAVAEEAFSVLRHLLRNKLGTIRNAAFYIKQKVSGSEVWAADPRIKEFFDVIDEEITAADALVLDGVVSERLFARRVEPVSARECVEQAVLLAHIETPGIHVLIGPGDATLHVDARELTLAVRCLVENAVEAMPSGGVVAVYLYEKGGRFLIEVLDEGPGIPEAERQAVLYAYCTTKPGHAGMGLSIASRLMARAKGTITIGSSESGGASVVLSFPLPERGEAAAG